MNILITGYNGFIGKNFIQSLENKKKNNIFKFGKENNIGDLEKFIFKCDIIFHLAGENRNKNKEKFISNNINLTSEIVNIIKKKKKKTYLIFSSTNQVGKKNNIYSKTKLSAEKILKKNSSSLFHVKIYRLSNIFGKWSKPNYNSAVATFCHNISRNKKIRLSKFNEYLELLYIDDVINLFLLDLKVKIKKKFEIINKYNNIYNISLYDLAKRIKFFKENRKNLLNNLQLANGFNRVLYSTYLSYVPEEDFKYLVEPIKDKRGSFLEFLKSKKNGQISILTVKPKQTRGNHYHMTKVEKFFVLAGESKFLFKNLISKKEKKIFINSSNKYIVETIPGWIHNITNTGKVDLIVLLWSNEIFDKKKPDTVYYKL